MIETLIEYKDGDYVDYVFDLIYKIVASKHNVITDDLFEVEQDGLSNGECTVNKEIYQGDINNLYDDFESVLLEYLNN